MFLALIFPPGIGITFPAASGIAALGWLPALCSAERRLNSRLPPPRAAPFLNPHSQLCLWAILVFLPSQSFSWSGSSGSRRDCTFLSLALDLHTLIKSVPGASRREVCLPNPITGCKLRASNTQAPPQVCPSLGPSLSANLSSNLSFLVLMCRYLH